MEGFFSRSELIVRKPTPRIPQCGKCGLLKQCNTPKIPVAGLGKKEILIIGEAPGAIEDKLRKPGGNTWQFLQSEFRQFGIDVDKDCWVTYALSCHPPGNKIDDDKKIEYCRPLVLKAIETLQPKVIILLGFSSIKSVIGYLWKDRLDSMGQWVGWQIPSRKWNCWICPTYHPSFLIREGKQDPVANRMFRSHIEKALATHGQPYNGDEMEVGQDIQILMNPGEAAQAIRTFPSAPMVAFDFETTTLKSQGPNAEIYCCSMSNGIYTIAYPWHGSAIKATKELLINPEIKKIGWNAKFEANWIRAKLGIRVVGWAWDGMLAAHALDTRGQISSLKFQAFVRLGIENYALAIEPFLKSKDGLGNQPNTIKEANLRQVLKYCGMDSLLEHQLGTMQMKEFENVS